MLVAKSICAVLVVAPSTTAFTPHAARVSRPSPMRMSDSVMEQNTAGMENVAILESFPLAGDYGFDPLGLSKIDFFSDGAEDKARSPEIILRDYRDAELRHGRLAMLAALAWPVQELLSPSIARLANREFGNPGLSDILTETSGRSPSVLNGGLEELRVFAFLIGVGAGIGAIDSVSIRIKEELGPKYVPGDFGFDPLNLSKGMSTEAFNDMQEKEINNGRLAMIAVTAFVIEEALSGLPVIQLTPGLFHPLWESPGVWSFLDAAFGVASSAQRIPAEQVTGMFQ